MSSDTPEQPAGKHIGDRLFANAPLLLTFTTLFWGGNAVAGKFAVGEVSPMVLTAARWIISSSLLIWFSWPHLRRDWPVIRKHAVYLCLLGVFGFAAFNAALYTSLKYTTAINVTLLQAGMPMIIFALNFAAFRTRVHWAQIFGYSITLMGVLLVASGGNVLALGDLELNYGDSLMLLAAFIYSCYSVALKSRPDIHWLSFMTVLVTAAAVASVGFAAAEISQDAAIWPVSGTAWMVILYTALFPSLLGQVFFARGVELFGSNRAGLFMNLVPIFGAILAVGLLGEHFSLHHAIALILVIGGITIAQNLTPRSL